MKANEILDACRHIYVPEGPTAAPCRACASAAISAAVAEENEACAKVARHMADRARSLRDPCATPARDEALLIEKAILSRRREGEGNG